MASGKFLLAPPPTPAEARAEEADAHVAHWLVAADVVVEPSA